MQQATTATATTATANTATAATATPATAATQAAQTASKQPTMEELKKQIAQMQAVQKAAAAAAKQAKQAATAQKKQETTERKALTDARRQMLGDARTAAKSFNECQRTLAMFGGNWLQCLKLTAKQFDKLTPAELEKYQQPQDAYKYDTCPKTGEAVKVFLGWTPAKLAKVVEAYVAANAKPATK